MTQPLTKELIVRTRQWIQTALRRIATNIESGQEKIIDDFPGGDSVCARPRQVRIEFRGATHHVMCRGARREEIFPDDRDREIMLAFLAPTVEKTGWQVQAWVWMSNHSLEERPARSDDCGPNPPNHRRLAGVDYRTASHGRASECLSCLPP